MRFSPSTQAFYPEDIEYLNLPADVITVTTAEWQAAVARGPYDTLAMSEAALVVVPGSVPILTNSESAQLTIFALERSITERRLREAILGIDNGWLKNIDSKITDLRRKL